MECRTVRRKLSVYLDNAASEETRRAMKAHLNRCHECALEWEQWGYVRESLRGLAPKAAPEDLKSFQGASSLTRWFISLMTPQMWPRAPLKSSFSMQAAMSFVLSEMRLG